MRTICKNVYRFSELSETAKEKALQKWAERHEYYDGDDVLETLKLGVDFFGFTLRDYCIDYSYASGSYAKCSFDGDYEDEVSELTGSRLYSYLSRLTWQFLKPKVFSLHADGKKKSCHFSWKYDNFSWKYDKCVKYRKSKILKVDTFDDCPLTGMCYDYWFLKPVIDWMKKPDTKTTFKELFDDCVNSLFEATEEDYEYQISMEYFMEHAEANECEFYEDGSWL